MEPFLVLNRTISCKSVEYFKHKGYACSCEILHVEMGGDG